MIAGATSFTISSGRRMPSGASAPSFSTCGSHQTTEYSAEPGGFPLFMCMPGETVLVPALPPGRTNTESFDLNLYAAGCLNLLPPHFHRRIDRGVERIDPAFPRLIAHGGRVRSRARVAATYATLYPRPRRGGALRLVLDQIGRRTAGNANRAHAALGIESAARRKRATSLSCPQV